MENKASVMIVDDNISACKTLSFILEEEGYDVTTAKDGPEAIAVVEERPFDIIFMDIRMPLMDGVETYRRIKRVRPDCVVVMMTAYAVEELVREALQEGAYAVMYKPLDIEEMVALIERVTHADQGALILVVDDDPEFCITFTNVLVTRGYKVGTADTGEEAISMTQERAYDIIFIDMRLPTLNGLETYLAIRKIDQQAVAIMMTAYRQEMAELVEAALNNTAYACIYKPLDLEEVLTLTNKILQRKQKTG